MMRAIVLAVISVGALAEEGPLVNPRRTQVISVAGQPTCLCLTKVPDSVVRVDCTYEFAPTGVCYQTVGLISNFTLVPAGFGESCIIHFDPSPPCVDLTCYPPCEKAASDQADWCLNKWCYVDPCNCDVADATKSDYFPGELFYSYGTCGDKNTYVATYSATNTVGNAECASSGEGSQASDAYPVTTLATTGFGLLLAVVGFLA